MEDERWMHVKPEAQKQCDLLTVEEKDFILKNYVEAKHGENLTDLELAVYAEFYYEKFIEIHLERIMPEDREAVFSRDIDKELNERYEYLKEKLALEKSNKEVE